jgi:hypothetical protein
MKAERRMPAGTNWAKTTTTPQVKKKQTPMRPMPLTPPAYPIPKENNAIVNTRTEAKSIKIFFIFQVISFSKPYLFTGDGSTPGRRAFSSAAPFSASFLRLKTMFEEVPTNEKKRMAAGINCRRTMTAPMMMKIQRATPASFRESDFANAGVAIKMINPIVIPVAQSFLSFSIQHPSFLLDATSSLAFYMPRSY